MLQLDAELGQPRFSDARATVAAALAEARWPERISVPDAVRRKPEDGGRVLNNPGAFSGPWADSPHDMHYADRAMWSLGSDSPYAETVIEGGSQMGKSEVGNNWHLHTILYDPADVMFMMPDKESIRSYITTQFTRMLDAQPKLRARQLAGPSADNINLKQFRGCDFHFLYPSGPNFRARPISRGRLDDLDDFPDDIADQGDAVSLLEGRMASFDAFGGTKKYINSTPKKGANGGIAALRAGGTDERWWVDCLHCNAPFELDTEFVLSFDRTGTAEQAAATAEVVCPGCGGCHRQRDKRALMATGRWIGRGQHAVTGGIEGELVSNRRLSQRWDGLMGMRTWANIAHRWRSAEIAFEIEQDEGPLKAVFQTIIGKNYVAKGVGEPPVSEDALKQRARASGHRLGTVPPGAMVLIASVDQQANRFEVAIWAFGPGFRAWLVDRFAVSVIMENGRERSLKPFTRAEDWAVLHDRVLSMTYPMANAPDLRMKIFNTAVDTGGLDNATDNAFAWWHAMVSGDVGSGRVPVPPTALTLIKGGNKPNARLLPPPTVDAKRQIKGAPQAELFVPNVHRFKDIADVRLKRSDGGPGTIAFPADVDAADELVVARYIAEMKGETNINGVWTRDPHRANETWDLYIYAYVVVVRFGGSDASLSWVPAWARPPKGAPKSIVTPAPMIDVIPDRAEVERPVPPSTPSPRRPTARRPSAKRGVRVVRSR